MSLTTIDIDDEALDAAMKLSGARTKKEAVNTALRDYTERNERIAALEHYRKLGKKWDYEHWRRQHEAEKRGEIN